MAAVLLSQHSSSPLDDKNCLIVNTIFLANLSQTIISFDRVFEQCIADVFWRQQVVLAHDVFKLLSFLLVASVINPVGIKEENVPPDSSALALLHPRSSPACVAVPKRGTCYDQDDLRRICRPSGRNCTIQFFTTSMNRGIRLRRQAVVDVQN